MGQVNEEADPLHPCQLQKAASGFRLRASANGGHRGPVKNDEADNPRMASLYREVVLKEKPAVTENGFIPVGALGKANGNGAHAPRPEVAEPVAGD
jgi:hypothetical protein